MINTMLRNGNFTSSEIAALTKLARDGKSFGAPAWTYIEECNIERRLGRCITDDVNAKAFTWGKLLEIRAFELLGLEYSLTSHVTDVHPKIPFWSGSKDGIKKNTVIDIKAPLTLKSFCQLVDPIYDGLKGMDAINAIRKGYVDKNGLHHSPHKDGEKYYWQLVSNSIINKTKYAELIPYMPYHSELDEVRMLAQRVPENELHKHYWISMANENELPYLPDNGFYKNINIIRFLVPKADKEFLTRKVKEAGRFLINNKSGYSILLARRDKKVNATIIETA